MLTDESAIINLSWSIVIHGFAGPGEPRPKPLGWEDVTLLAFEVVEVASDSLHKLYVGSRAAQITNLVLIRRESGGGEVSRKRETGRR